MTEATTTLTRAARRLGESAGLRGIVGIVSHRGAQFVHGRGRLLQGARLLLGAPRQLQAALADLRAGMRHLNRVAAHGSDGVGQGHLHLAQCEQQLTGLATPPGIDVGSQVAGGNAPCAPDDVGTDDERGKALDDSLDPLRLGLVQLFLVIDEPVDRGQSLCKRR